MWKQGSTLATKRLSIVDLGYVNDVKISDRNVLVSLTMPYPGRATWQRWFSRLISQQVGSRIDDVGGVDIRVVHQPVWNVERMTHKARRRLGMLSAAQ